MMNASPCQRKCHGKFILKGYDVISKRFFVKEEATYKHYGENNETVVRYFDTFNDYFNFIDGDIYRKSVYYDYSFDSEEINKYSIDLKKINRFSLLKSNIDDFTLAFNNEEENKYRQQEAFKSDLKTWIEKFNACNDYQSFCRVLQDYKRNRINNVRNRINNVETCFFLYHMIAENKEKAFDIIMEYINNDDPMGFETIMCMYYDPLSVIRSFDPKWTFYTPATIKKHIRNFRDTVDLFTSNLIRYHHISYFDDTTHYYVCKITGYIEKNNKLRIIFRTKKYFETFDGLADYLKNDLANCDLSNAVIPDLDISKYLIYTSTKLPLSYSKIKTYAVEKKYDRDSHRFTVNQVWYDTNDNIIKKYDHSFEFFFDFLFFLKKDLSNADLLFCDNINNLITTEGIVWENIKANSSFMTRINQKCAPAVINDTYSFECTEVNEKNTALTLFESKNDSYDSLKNYKIYYVSDLHLLHKIKKANCQSYYDIVITVQKIIDKLFENFSMGTAVLFAGDISSDYSLFELFVKLLDNTLSVKFDRQVKVFFILGNHDLWNVCDDMSQTISKYKNLLETHNMILLQNSIYYLSDSNRENVISIKDFLSADADSLRKIFVDARLIILGGIGFSGYNETFNANHGIYRNALTRKQEIEESNLFEQLYNKVNEILFDKKVIVCSHMPLSDWHKKESYNKNFIYVNGHTHKNYYFTDGEYYIYADNQIGYYSNYGILKYFVYDNSYDIFCDYSDGIYEISKEDYAAFYRGKNYLTKLKRPLDKIIMLKKYGYYCFLIQNDENGCYILNGGAPKKLPYGYNSDYCYNNMDKVIHKIQSPLRKYKNYQQLIAKQIVSFGGTGKIHGCIIDIDYFNHLYINPIDHKITPYFAYDMIRKQVYPNIGMLLKEKRPELYHTYLLQNNQNSNIPMIYSPSQDDKTIYLDTDIYKASLEMKKFERLDSNILTVWLEPNDLDKLE